jgi:hypothetical protein
LIRRSPGGAPSFAEILSALDGWTSAFLAIVYDYSIFVPVGSMAIVDFRVMGIMARGIL